MKKKNDDETSVWISTADLMSGLLVLFLFISVLMIQSTETLQGQIREITGSANAAREELRSNIEANFSAEEMKAYKLNVDSVGSASFDKGEARFQAGSSQLTPEFQAILKDFLPKYIDAAYNCDHDSIQEIRIEGHTSSEWYTGNINDPNIAYINNMALSQSRTREIIKFALSLPELAPYQDFIKEKLTANGLSSSKIIKHPDGSEDAENSRRIEFKVIANDAKVVKQMEEALN